MTTKESVDKFVDYRHIFLYARLYYPRVDPLKDLKVILAERLNIHSYQISSRYVLQVLIHLVLTHAKSKDYYSFIIAMVSPLLGEEIHDTSFDLSDDHKKLNFVIERCLARLVDASIRDRETLSLGNTNPDITAQIVAHAPESWGQIL